MKLAKYLSALAGLALSLTGSLSAKDTWYVSDHLATTVASIDVAGEIAPDRSRCLWHPVEP
jgi:hypothetical protein